MGRILRYYLFKQHLKVNAYLLFCTFTLMLLIDFTENSGRLSTLPGYSFFSALFFSLLRMPAVLQKLLPFITLFAGIIMLVSLNRNLELIAIRASGVSVWQILLPPCLGAFLLGICAFFFLNPLSSWGEIFSKTLALRWQENTGMPVSEKFSPFWLVQNTEEGITILGAKTVFDTGRTLVEATFVRFKQDNTIRDWIHAKTTKLEKGYWLLLDGTRYQVDYKPEKFDQMRITTLIKSKFIEEHLAHPTTITIPFYDLPRKIRIAQSFGHSTDVFVMQLQTLLALPVFLVAMTLIAALVSLEFSRLKQSGLLTIYGLLSGVVLYVINTLAETLGYNGYISPVLAAWIPVFVALLLGILFLLYREDG